MAVKLAARITQRTNELIASIKRNPVNLVDVIAHAESHIGSLRYDARLAHLDGRTARARALNREANRLNRVVSKPSRA